GLPGEVAGAEQRFDVQVSGTSYVLFVVPSFFVLREDGKPTGLAFYGLVRKDDLEARALRLPSLGMPAIVIAFVIGMAFLWPALKLYTMSDRERLKKSSVVTMCGITLVAAVLLATLYLSFGFFLSQSERNDHELRQLAGMIHTHLVSELKTGLTTSRDIIRELVELEQGDSTRGQTGKRQENADWWPADSRFPISALIANQNIIATAEKYPFFSHIILTGQKPPENSAAVHAGNERQIIKLSAALPTPLIELPEPEFP